MTAHKFVGRHEATERLRAILKGEIQRGIDRLLLVIEDYEQLHESIGEFLVTKFLPALKNDKFRSVIIILGRDQLEVTHIGWDQHLKSSQLERIELNPLTQEEMNELVKSFGINNIDEKERAWRDTQGCHFYVRLWIEETKSGGRSAVKLKRFYDRTTYRMSDKEKEWLYLTLFLDRVDKRTLQSMTDNTEEAESILNWFEREGSVRDTTGDVYRVQEYLRSRLIDYLRITDPDKYEALDRKGRLVRLHDIPYSGNGVSSDCPGSQPTLSLGIRPALARNVEDTSMSLISIRMPEDLEQVLRPVLERDPDKGTEWLRAGFEARLVELYQQWQALRISTARFAELLGVSPWELADLLRDRGLKATNLPG